MGKDFNATLNVPMPWAPQGTALVDIYRQAYDQSKAEIPFYQGQGFVDFSPQSETAMGLMQQRALGSSPYEQANQQYLARSLGQGQMDLGFTGAAAQYGQEQGLQAYNPLQQTAQGQMLGGNPYLDAQYDQAAQAVTRQFSESVLPGVNATFGGAGRTGSGAHQAAVSSAQGELAGQLSGMAAQMYGNNYQQERTNQLQAANQLAGMGIQQGGLLGDLYGNINEAQARASALTPQAAALEYGNIDALARVGATLEGQGRTVLTDDMSRYDYYANLPRNNLEWYGNFIQPGVGGTGGASATPDKGNKAQKAFGGAAAGASAGAAAGPYGALIGGAVGLLGGLFA